MKFFLHSVSGDGLGLAKRLVEEGNAVSVYIDNKHAKTDYDGMLTKQDSAEPPDSEHIVIFDANGNGSKADALRQRGFKVFLGGSLYDQLELDRAGALKIMDEAGIQQPPWKSFNSWNSARAHVQQFPDKRMVFKPSGKLGEHSMSYVAADSEDMLQMLHYFETHYGQHGSDIVLQDFVECDACVSTEGWFNGVEWVEPFNHTLERKQLMDGDEGPSGGCSGNIVWAANHNWLVVNGIMRMAPYLRSINFVGPIDLNVALNKDGLWALEFTPRFGYDALPAFMELLDEEIGGLISDMMQGPNRRTMKLKSGFASALRVTIPPYPADEFHPHEGIPIRGIPEPDIPRTYFYNVRKNSTGYESTPAFGVVAAFTGHGESIHDALHRPHELAKLIKVPNKQYRSDMSHVLGKEHNVVMQMLSRTDVPLQHIYHAVGIATHPGHLLAIGVTDANFAGVGLQNGTQLFRKQLLRYGRWIHPADESKFFVVTPELCDQLVRNFNEKNFNDLIPVFMAKDQSAPHKVDPDDGVGRIVGLERDVDGLYAVFEFQDPVLAGKAGKNLIPGVSAAISLQYMHKEKGQDVGPVLRNVVVCNEPYIKNLRGFQQVQFSDSTWDVLEFSEVRGGSLMNRQTLEALATKLGIKVADFTGKADDVLLAEVNRLLDVANANLAEVPALKEKATKHDVLLSENTTLKTEVQTLKGAAPEQAKVVELASKVTALETERTSQAAKITELELAAKRATVTSKVDGWIRDGKITPAQKADVIELGMANEAMMVKLYDKAPAIVPLGERGVLVPGTPLTGDVLTPEQTKTEVDRYVKMIPGHKAA